ncbi:hypothetical protein ADICYQ_1848 [Cyclobacterium qasimii M12-11B]|uniref:Uncharacterized protein n=2 Tax=Cyclobacterium qasimii TaxID=1350429 RepID=S7VGC8_9BACT|nr:hypothetical protein ADICYQ_1848 [Cyclobacterium qasimii M12-11B]GEO22476.1 hypothetical protein CQA01_30100 [Cyclobacterium qasimii]
MKPFYQVIKWLLFILGSNTIGCLILNENCLNSIFLGIISYIFEEMAFDVNFILLNLEKENLINESLF